MVRSLSGVLGRIGRIRIRMGSFGVLLMLVLLKNAKAQTPPSEGDRQ